MVRRKTSPSCSSEECVSSRHCQAPPPKRMSSSLRWGTRARLGRMRGDGASLPPPPPPPPPPLLLSRDALNDEDEDEDDDDDDDEDFPGDSE